MLKIETKSFEIEIDGDRGCFEHKHLGDEVGGGLWFEGKELIDYDGVYSLPKEVAAKLKELGYKLPDGCCDEES